MQNMSQGSILSEKPKNAAGAIANSFPSIQSSYQKKRKDITEKYPVKKKIEWKKRPSLQLQLKLKDNNGYNQFISQKSIVVSTPVFTPLRLKKTNSNSLSLSAKYSLQFFPTISLANSQISSPFLDSKNSEKITHGHIDSYTNDSSNCTKYVSSSSSSSKNSKTTGFKNDYSNNYIHSGTLPFKYIRNSKQQVEGYPKLQRLYKLKEQQVAKYATRPYGARVKTENLVKTLNSWVYDHNMQFDVIMIGALIENQLIYSLLAKLPIDKLCAKPGFLFIWASTQKISELSNLLNDSRTWAKRFRRSEELVFIPVDKNSVYYPKDSSIPEEQILEEVQWHCWMCITGTVRRSTDKDIIHCNINTDLCLENSSTGNSAVPSQIYKVVENFSSSTRRLHIIPTSTGLEKHVKVRPGWVIISPDVILDNFEPDRYKKDIEIIGSNIPYNDEIEQLRPKTPI